MDKKAATELLKNLLERAHSSDSKTFLTSMEIAALSEILDAEETIAAPNIAEQKEDIPEIALVDIELSDVESDTLMCVDFGTSFSKAFVCKELDNVVPELIDLAIGIDDDGSPSLITPSEMFIENHRIYFGRAARKIFDDTRAEAARLIDSIKQYMTLESVVSDLGKLPVEKIKDPDRTFSRRDILLLYLSHLMHLSEKALLEAGLSLNTKRRFAHPAWEKATNDENTKEMRTMMAEAIILARSLGEHLDKSITVRGARSALDQVKNFSDQLPLMLIGEPVREATAAGAGALIETPLSSVGVRKREPFIILDIGAGTTDVAGCYCINDENEDRPRVYEVEGAAGAAKSAGNILDGALVKLVLEKSTLAFGAAEYAAASESLIRNKRQNKEQLFNFGEVVLELPTGEIVEVELEEFIHSESVQKFTNIIKDVTRNAVMMIAGDYSKLNFVATGGGAGLPIIRTIADEGIDVDGKHFDFEWCNPMPTFIPETNPDLVGPYPQLAVAVGGALPVLPEQGPAIPEGLKSKPEYEIAPSYKS